MSLSSAGVMFGLGVLLFDPFAWAWLKPTRAALGSAVLSGFAVVMLVASLTAVGTGLVGGYLGTTGWLKLSADLRAAQTRTAYLTGLLLCLGGLLSATALWLCLLRFVARTLIVV